MDIKTIHHATNEPETSRLAAEQLVESGQWDGQLEAVRSLLERNPGLTSRELARAGGTDKYLVARRLSDMKNLGLAIQGISRKCEVSGRLCVTWYSC